MEKHTYLCKVDFDGAIDGVSVRRYRAGATYQLPVSFARERVNNGKLEPVEAPPEQTTDEQFPDDYREYVALREFEIPEQSGEAASLVKKGEVIGMSAKDAESWLKNGWLRQKSRKGSPKNKARKSAPNDKG